MDQEVVLRASPTEVMVYDGPTQIARHPRSLESHQDIIDPQHVEEVLARKRRASGTTLQQLFLALAPEAQVYLAGLVKTELSVVATYGKAEVLGAILRALQYGAYGADYVENIVLAERRKRREGQKTQLQIKKIRPSPRSTCPSRTSGATTTGSRPTAPRRSDEEIRDPRPRGAAPP